MGLFFNKKPKQPLLNQVSNATKISNIKKENNDSFHKLSLSSRKNLQAGEIGFYRNDLFSMASILEKEGNLNDALKQFLYVFYLDLTGISNVAANTIGIKPRPTIAPGVVKRIRIIKKKLSLTYNDLKDIYFQCNKENIMGNTIFSYSESYDLLEVCLSDGCDAAELIIKKKICK